MSKSDRVGAALSRKDFLSGVGIAAAAAAGAGAGVATQLGYSPASVADNEPILIGDVDESSGVYAVSGGSQSLGKKVCVEEWNARGGVLGRKIQLIHADTAAKPDVAVPNATKLVEQDKVDVLVGEVSSGVGLALSALAQRLGIVFVAAGTHDTTITGSNAHPCCFRTTAANSMLANATAKALLPYGKKWFFITPDYAYGHSAQAGFQAVLEANGGQSLGNELTAFPTNSGDFTAQLTKAKNSGADVLVLSWYGGDLVNGMKQYVQLGLDKVFKQVGGPLNGVEVGLGYGAENNRGIWGAPWAPDYPTDGSKQLGQKLRAAGAQYVDWRMYLGWLACEAAITGILRAGTTEATRLVSAIEGLTFNGLQKKFCHIRACDHQNELDVLVTEAIPKSQWKFPNQFFKINQIVPASDTLEPCDKSDAPAKLAQQTIPTREGYTPKSRA
ncbi:MAG: ABC transporter substrate-binding protein [Candidatus Eremiobacteraeota bacterium]|nr:ABC transporter substrate-binding protein [Candidatus Eremiobacteraeota bacterium]MBV8365340.1 ABC transporter substrate-binding protein [Candidatus Eremiobacteraeota bacterium]